jgi:hypothetical protein
VHILVRELQKLISKNIAALQSITIMMMKSDWQVGKLNYTRLSSTLAPSEIWQAEGNAFHPSGTASPPFVISPMLIWLVVERGVKFVHVAV